MKFYTIGYGGRKPEEFIVLLKHRDIKLVVDVRLRPDRASFGIYKKANDSNKGIERLLSDANIKYISLVELGNMFKAYEGTWEIKYKLLLDKVGDLLTEQLKNIPIPFCLMCAEKLALECHRWLIADYLVKKGWEVEHIE